MAATKPASKLHLTIDGQTNVCERPGAKELTSSFNDATCSWCQGRIKSDPVRYLIEFSQAGAPKEVLKQIWGMAKAQGSPVDVTQLRIDELEADLALQRSIQQELSALMATYQFEG